MIYRPRTQKPYVGEVPFWNLNPIGIPPPVGAWIFNEGGGGTVFDLSGNKSDGTIIGAIWTPGRTGQTLGFDGTQSDYISVPSSSYWDFGIASFTISFWIKYFAEGDDSIIIGTGQRASAGEWRIMTEATGMRFMIENDGANIAWSVNTEDNNWHHIVLVRDVENILFYKDGVAQTLTATEGEFTALTEINGASDLRMMGGYGFNDTFHTAGLMDDVKIWNSALTSSQVDYIYQHPYYAWERTPIWAFGAEILAPGEAIVSKMYGINMSNIAEIYGVPKQICA